MTGGFYSSGETGGDIQTSVVEYTVVLEPLNCILCMTADARFALLRKRNLNSPVTTTPTHLAPPTPHGPGASNANGCGACCGGVHVEAYAKKKNLEKSLKSKE